MQLQCSYNASEDKFPLPERIRAFYGLFGFPEPPAGRPHITSNFVMGLDGRASFREIQGHTGGKDVSRSTEDRWLMQFLRAHHDAINDGREHHAGGAGRGVRRKVHGKWSFSKKNLRRKVHGEWSFS